MTVLDYILDGIEAELALERELGFRSVECDRALLAEIGAAREKPSSPVVSPVAAVQPRPVEPSVPPRPAAPAPASPPADAAVHGMLDFVFLHHEPLSPEGETMMAKIVAALGKTPETAPVVWEKPIPKARIYVVLGSHALRKFQPKLKGAPGQWLKTEKGADVLVTYSPHYFLRFKTVTPVLQQNKRDMWKSLKAMGERLKA